MGGLLRACEAAYPEEACGLLVGRRGADGGIEVDRIEASANLARDRRHRFEVDPRLQIRLFRELRGGPDQVVGLYHSHPDGRALPSATDLARAWEPEFAWLIAAVHQGRAVAVRAHLLDRGDGGFREIRLQSPAGVPYLLAGAGGTQPRGGGGQGG